MKRSILIFLVFAIALTGYTESSAQASLTMTPNVIKSGEDYTFDQRGYYWDFSSSEHYGVELSRPAFPNGQIIQNGWLMGEGIVKGKGLYLLNPQINGINPTQNEGVIHPIVTSKYRYLTLSVCLSNASVVGVAWYRSRSDTAPGVAGVGFPAGCSVKTVDLVNDFQGGTTWLAAGTVTGMAITFNVDGINVQIDFARLTLANSVERVTITWPPRSGTVSFSISDDPVHTRASVVGTANAADGSWVWNVPPLEPGKYYLKASYSDGSSQTTEFTVNHPPLGSITSPSYTSGPDYATTVIGDPWDMNETTDILQYHNVSGLQVNSGILSGYSIAGNNDPELIFNGPQLHPIDPNQFYYFTYRMRDPLPQDVFGGSVARIFWSDSNSQYFLAATSKDILIYDGWKSVTIDLRKALLEQGGISWQAAARDGIRLDPHEFSYPRLFELDDVKLTGNDRANNTYRINYLASDSDGSIDTLELRYSTSPDGSNSIPISCATGTPVQPPAGLSMQIFLPLILRGDAFCTWNTTQIPNGDYYIVLVARDAYDQTVRVSETPVEIRH